MTGALVLCYHALSPTWSAQLSTTPDRFAWQMRHLARKGWRGVTFAEAVVAPADRRMLAVTFDDAFRSVRDHAKPVLDELGWPATVFVPTDFPERGALSWPGIDHWEAGSDRAELAAMTWDELASLAGDGWEIGSHTCSHPRLTALGDEELRREIGASRAECERRLGAPPATIAYPYGDVDDRVVAAAVAAGYAAAAALPGRLHEARRHEWPRVGVYRKDNAFRFRLKVAGLRRRAGSSRAPR